MTGRDRKVFVIAGVLVALLASWFMVISPKRDQASKLGGQIKAEQQQLSSIHAQLAAGQAAKSSYATSYASLVRLGEAVPADDNVPSLIYQLQGAANSAHVDFQTFNLTPGASGSSPAAPATPPPSSSSSSSSSSAKPASGTATPASTSSGSATPASSASAAQSATAGLPPGATVGPAGFPIEPFSFTFQGNFFHLADFFGRLERFVVASNQQLSVSGRLMTLNAISLGPAPSGFPQITASISATTFLVPAAQGLMNGASPAAPPSSATPVSTSTASTAPPPAAITPPAR